MKDFFERLNTIGQPKRNDIIEKDYHLHRLLDQISKDEYLRNNLIFKGGTCLMKGYTGYYRFSEDIDFTWYDSSIWRNKNKSETIKLCSKEIDKLILQFKEISNRLGLIFSGDKSNIDEVHISSGGRMVLFYISYKSEILNIVSRIKIEINFMDISIYPFVNKLLKSYVKNIETDELKFLYENLWKEYNRPVSLKCYDLREIFIEKCRALLTRKTYKLRDVIDIYFMENSSGFSISDYKLEIIKKTKFMLDLYKRYRENIHSLDFPDIDLLESEEMKLMIIPPPDDFVLNIYRTHSQLEEIKNILLE